MKKEWKEKTRLTTLGRDPDKNFGIINPPVYHASTVLFPSVAVLEGRKDTPPRFVRYGLGGTPTQFSLEDALCELEGAYGIRLFPSGLAAIAVALMAYLKTGDHLLMVDSVYGPTREFCERQLSRFGVDVAYYDPMIGSGIEELMRPETAVVFTESPGSHTFEVQDIPAIAEVAHRHGALVMLDNTWASPLYFKPFEKGVDVSIHAGTKYISGHSDVMLGTVSTTEEAWPALSKTHDQFGQQAAPDDCYLALRGLRTMAVRIERQQKSALELAKWLKTRPEVFRVLHPAFPECPGHEFWKRDFTGASGLFGVMLNSYSDEALARMLDGMELFGMGFSWGGFESLIVPSSKGIVRKAGIWESPGPVVRISVGLEEVDDLIADLEAGFARLAE